MLSYDINVVKWYAIILDISILHFSIFYRKTERKIEELRLRRRMNKNKPLWLRLGDFIPIWLMLNYRNKYGLLFATATVLFGLYAYLKATEANIAFLR